MKMRLMFELSFAVLVYLAVSDGEHSHYRRVHVRPGYVYERFSAFTSDRVV